MDVGVVGFALECLGGRWHGLVGAREFANIDYKLETPTQARNRLRGIEKRSRVDFSFFAPL